MLTYTVFSLGEAQLHQLHTSQGKVRDACSSNILPYSSSNHVHVVCLQLFVMGEVAVELFQESPTAFLQVGTWELLGACHAPWGPV